jgi:hypothetical protein
LYKKILSLMVYIDIHMVEIKKLYKYFILNKHLIIRGSTNIFETDSWVKCIKEKKREREKEERRKKNLHINLRLYNKNESLKIDIKNKSKKVFFNNHQS